MQTAEIFVPELTILTILCLLMGFSVLYFLHQNNERLLVQKESFKRELLLTQLEIQEQTFQRISQELHDNIGQCLALAKLHLVYREIRPSEDSIQRTTAIIDQCIEDIRNFSKSLNAAPVKGPCLHFMVDNFIEQVRTTGRYQISVQVEGEKMEIGYDRELMIYRIIQEAFHNIIKHSQADTVALLFTYRKSNELELSIADNGLGFNVEEALKKAFRNGSSGLQNIIRRVKVLGASYNIISNLNKGTQLCITIPI